MCRRRCLLNGRMKICGFPKLFKFFPFKSIDFSLIMNLILLEAQFHRAEHRPSFCATLLMVQSEPCRQFPTIIQQKWQWRMTIPFSCCQYWVCSRIYKICLTHFENMTLFKLCNFLLQPWFKQWNHGFPSSSFSGKFTNILCPLVCSTEVKKWLGIYLP